MKKIFYLSIALLSALPCFAQKANTEEEYDLLQRSYQQRLDVLKIQDDLLQALLKIPFEKRVYVYPALFESRNILKKITTHPQIAIWKGKKPTKIAPQMQEFAQKHLDFMPAKFYPLLDPDGWPKQNKEGDWHSVGDMLKDVVVTPNDISTDEFLNQTN